MPEARHAAGAPEILRMEAVGSTNTEALARARTGTLGDAWIVATEQTGGRGRHGRSWASPPGGLYATRLLVTAVPLHHLVGLTLVAGLAAHDAAAAVLPGPAAATLALKWPNDLLSGNAKLAGILIETERLADGRTAVAVGMGLNVAAGVACESGAAAIEGLGGSADPAIVFEALAAAFAARLAEWDEGRDFAATRAAWTARALPPGTPMRVRLPAGTIHGTFEGLDASGGLTLRLPSGEAHTVRAGEVVLTRDPKTTKESA
jgi:BirA family biotin operon repressor/biotin-[acetyl-CoA-carboxylase] ligase